MSLDLERIRNGIDNCNKEIIELIDERMDYVLEVAEHKHENDMQIVDEEREEEVRQDFADQFEEKGMPPERGKEFADVLIATAIDLEAEKLDREIERRE
ncbi:MAG: chorismate mutase [Candidatus Nanohaloarchaea archaeon]|jgi:chorismate mutase